MYGSVREANIRKFILILLLFLAFVQGAIAQGDAGLPATLKIGVYNNPPKIGVFPSGEPYGFHYEIMEALLDESGIKPIYVAGTWDEGLARLAEGSIDVMVDVAYSDERAKSYDFNRESVLLNWAVVYSSNSESFKNITDLEGKRVAVMRDSIHTTGEGGIVKLAADFGLHCIFLYYDSYEATFTALKQGEADAAIVNRLFGLMNDNISLLKRTDIIFNPSQIKYAFPKGKARNAAIIRLFDSRIVQLKEEKDGVYQKAFAKYLLPEIAKEKGKREWIGNAILLAIAIFLIMALFLLSGRSGKSENKQMRRFFERHQSMGDIRSSIANHALVSYSLFSLPLFFSVVYHVLAVRWDPTIWLYVPALLIPALSALFRNRLDVTLKMAVITGFMFITGMLVFFSWGNIGTGFMYFLTAGIIMSLVYGKRSGLAVLTAGLLITVVFGFMVQRRTIQYKLDLISYFFSPSSWIFAIMSFFMMFFTIVSGIEKFYGSLVDAVDNLEDRIAERTNYIDKINKSLQEEIVEHKNTEKKAEALRIEAEEANKAKSIFLASMSHEIRTPLNAILGYSQILLHENGQSQETRRELEAINSSGEHLLELINEILEMSKIEAGKAELHTAVCDIQSILRQVEDMFKAIAEKKRIAFSIKIANDVPRNIISDEAKIKQILINLVGNAIKFTDSGSIGISVSLPESARDLIAFAVTDTGKGIAEEDLRKVFIAFEQTKEGRSKGGTGLGLAISLEYSRLLGGDLNVESRLGQGSTFIFTIASEPCSGQCADVPGPKPRIVGLAGNLSPKVLIVDDREINRDILVKLLTPLGFQTMQAGNGDEALELVNSWNPEVILLDLVMPGLSGKDVIRIIRADESKNRIKIIVITASVLEGEKDGVFDLGADSFIRKPFRENEILEEIGRLAKLEFRYEEPQTKGEANPAASGDELLKRTHDLPADMRRLLGEALRMGDLDNVKALVRDIAEIDTSLAEIIGGMADNFQIAKLLELFQ